MAMLVVTGLTGILFLGTMISSAWLIVALYCLIALAALSAFFVLFVPHKLQIPYKTKWVFINKIIKRA